MTLFGAATSGGKKADNRLPFGTERDGQWGDTTQNAELAFQTNRATIWYIRLPDSGMNLLSLCRGSGCCQNTLGHFLRCFIYLWKNVHGSKKHDNFERLQKTTKQARQHESLRQIDMALSDKRAEPPSVWVHTVCTADLGLVPLWYNKVCETNSSLF